MASVVGRKDELDAIDDSSSRSKAAARAVMLLSGMAGIGKTTLWNAGVGSAKDRQYRVVTARPTEVETGLAFASLGDLLTPLLDTARPDLPGPQREALDAALLRVSAASPPQPLGVSLGALHVLRAVGPGCAARWWPSTTSRGWTRHRRACSTSRSVASRRTGSGSCSRVAQPRPTSRCRRGWPRCRRTG